jgi:hypothetical protein
MTELYERLLSKISPLDESINLQQLADKINMFDKHPSEMTFILIRIHSLRNGEDIKAFQLPYQGKTDNKSLSVTKSSISPEEIVCDIIFNLDNFPNVLISLLNKFAKTVEQNSEYVPIKPVTPKVKQIISFVKKTIKLDPIITLRQIDFPYLDKTYSMNEIIRYGEKSLYNKSITNNYTSIDQIGLLDDNKYNSSFILMKKDNNMFPDNKMDIYNDEEELDTKFSLPKLSNHSSLCYYCSLQIPREWESVTLYDGIFCSFHCTRAYATEYKKPVSDIITAYKKLTGKNPSIIIPSPDRKLLEKFGGSLTPEEYRNLFDSINQIQNIQQIVTDPIYNNINSTEGFSSYKTQAQIAPVSFKEAPRYDISSYRNGMFNANPRIYKTN